jgi:hypothetical protein
MNLRNIVDIDRLIWTGRERERDLGLGLHTRAHTHTHTHTNTRTHTHTHVSHTRKQTLRPSTNVGN